MSQSDGRRKVWGRKVTTDDPNQTISSCIKHGGGSAMSLVEASGTG